MKLHQSVQLFLISNDSSEIQKINDAITKQIKSEKLHIFPTVDAAINELKNIKPDLIISDDQLVETAHDSLLTNELIVEKIPVIILSAEDAAAAAIKAIKSGAMNYLVKSDTTYESLPEQCSLALNEWRRIQLKNTSEQELIRSENKLAEAQKIAQIGNWEWDIVNQTFYCSDEFYRILGIANRIFKNGFTDILEFVHPNDRESVKNNLNKTLEIKIPFYMDFRLLQADGSERMVQSQARVQTSDSGDVIQLSGIIQDITRNHETYKQLQLLAAALEASADGIIITDDLGTIVWANPAMSALSGYRYTELIGKSPSMWSSKRHNNKFYNDLWQTIKSGNTWQGEITNRRKDGELYSEEQTITSVLNSQGKIKHFVAIKRDITERKKADAKNKQAAQVFEHSIEGIVITDENNKIIRVNPAFSKITGYSEFEAIGKSPSILASGKHDALFYQEMWRELNETGVWQGEIWNRRKNSEIYPELLTISTIKNDDDNIIEHIAVFTDITDRKQDEANIHRLAFYDVLTDLPNRALIQEMLRKALDNSDQENDRIGFLSIDIDNFFNINETMGHNSGDKLLQIIAQRILRCNAENDTTSRLSSDEFAIVMENIKSPGDIAKTAECILNSISQPIMLEKQEVFMTASIGIAISPDDGQSVQELLRNAESALSHAKREGNTFQFFNEAMNSQSFEQLAMKSSLRRALERDEFILHYQPQVDIKTGKIIGAESLIRWQHPDLGIVSPLRFIPILEQTGLINDVGLWAIETACQQNMQWQTQGLNSISIGVNLSPRQLRESYFTRNIQKILDKTGIDPHWLDLEVTESSIMENPDQVIKILRQINDMGIRISVDDFGTGYSSLSYLKLFPIDILKIDQSFTRDITHDDDDKAIVKTIVSMGHNLNMQVIAEGVEQKDQLEILKTFECDTYQGYFYSKPVPADEFEVLLRGEQD